MSRRVPQEIPDLEVTPGLPSHHRTLRSAGLPAGSKPWLLTSKRIRGRWDGFTFEGIGVRVDAAAEDMVDSGADTWIVPIPALAETWVFWIVRSRVVYQGAWLEVRWSRGRRSRIHVGGELESLSAEQWNRLGSGRDLLRGVVHGLGGRPRGRHTAWIEEMDLDQRRERAQSLEGLVRSGIGREAAGARWGLGRRAVNRELIWLDTDRSTAGTK